MSEATKDRIVRMLKQRQIDRQARDKAIEEAQLAYEGRWNAQAENALDCAAELAGVDERTPVEPKPKRTRKEKAAAVGGGEA